MCIIFYEISYRTRSIMTSISPSKLAEQILVIDKHQLRWGRGQSRVGGANFYFSAKVSTDGDVLAAFRQRLSEPL